MRTVVAESQGKSSGHTGAEVLASGMAVRGSRGARLTKALESNSRQSVRHGKTEAAVAQQEKQMQEKQKLVLKGQGC